MRVLAILAIGVAFAASAAAATSAIEHHQDAERASVVLQNGRVRVYRTTAGALVGVDHAPGVVIWIDDQSRGNERRALWLDDTALPPRDGAGTGSIVIVQ